MSLISGVLPMLSMKPDRTFLSLSRSDPARAPGSTVAQRLALAPALAHLVAVERQPLQSDHTNRIVNLVALDQCVGLGER